MFLLVKAHSGLAVRGNYGLDGRRTTGCPFGHSRQRVPGNGGDDHGAEEKTGLVSHGGYAQRPARLAAGLVKGLVEQGEVMGNAVQLEPVGPCPVP